MFGFRHNLNLTSEDMADLRRQGITSTTTNILPLKNSCPPKHPLNTTGEENSWIYDGIICARQSKNLHNPNSDFNNYSREEVMKKTNLDF